MVILLLLEPIREKKSFKTVSTTDRSLPSVRTSPFLLAAAAAFSPPKQVLGSLAAATVPVYLLKTNHIRYITALSRIDSTRIVWDGS
ncbi:hypothetical protein L1987_00465 [Smallanthus sonchifolius]|uniref:Uncharacterized protein n=1 Tax=Smallanthus sonchifolius TaxID=185202 RepID=A0ACB9K2E4_9ASTR|nr:hypothetical protein L1987_00465 [Smallanthus sonchifolius]